jgi:hypothetical protein
MTYWCMIANVLCIPTLLTIIVREGLDKLTIPLSIQGVASFFPAWVPRLQRKMKRTFVWDNFLELEAYIRSNTYNGHPMLKGSLW